MPTPTYDLIEEKVLGSATASVTFSSIPGTYKDLVLEVTGFAASGAISLWRVNNDTGTNYSDTIVYGSGTSAVSARNTNQTSGYVEIGKSSTVPGTAALHFMSYAQTNTNKTVLTRGNSPDDFVTTRVHLWRSTAAITRIDVIGSGNLGIGSTFRLWGVSG